METSLSLLERLTGKPTEPDWQRLVDLYQPLLRGWCLRSGVPEADADDLVQETLSVVCQEVGDFQRHRTGAFRSWLRTILTHRLRDFFRASRHRPVATGDSHFLERLAQLESPESELSQLFEREHDQYLAGKVMRMVKGDFEPATWEAFRRQVLDGVPAAEVAAEMHLSQNAVLLAKSRVLKRLRAEMTGLIDCSAVEAR